MAEKYREAPVTRAIANNGGLLEVTSNESGETWTIIITSPEGCVYYVAAGRFWDQIPFVLPTGESM